MTRLCRADRTRNATRSRVERSAQCRSSTMNSTGRIPLSRSRVPSTCSSSCALLMSSPARAKDAAGGAGPVAPAGAAAMTWASSGSSRDSAGAAAPSTSASCAGRHGPGQRAQRVDERREGQALGAELDALPGQHAAVLSGRELREFPGEPGLADAGLAADQGDRGPVRPRPVKQHRQGSKLLLPPDEDRADHVRAHAHTVP